MGSTKLLVYLSTRRQSAFYHSSDLNSTSSRRLSDTRPRYIFWGLFLKALSFPFGPLKQRGASQSPQIQRRSQTVTQIRDKGELGRRGRGAHAWHTSPFDLMAIPRMWWHLLRSINGCLIMSMMTPGRNTPVFHQGHNLKYSIHVWQIHHRNVLCLERDC